MTHSSASSRGKRRLGTAATAAAAALLTLLVTATVALSWDGSVPAPPDSPTSADQIQNLDQVKTAIKAYYGDTATGQLDPVAGTTALHTFSPTGAYANEMAGVEADAAKFLAQRGEAEAPRGSAKQAILLDVDDTTLNTYSYEIYSSFVYSPTTNATFVNAAVFPAVPGMPALVTQAQAEGYTIFFLTGRPETPARRARRRTSSTPATRPSPPATSTSRIRSTSPGCPAAPRRARRPSTSR